MAQFYNDQLLQKKPLEEISIINNNKFSLLEKTSVKLLPILKTLLKRMAFEDEPCNEKQKDIQEMEKVFYDEQLDVGGGSSLTDEADADMKNLLGYLNQAEWIFSLNIGNIMQIAPLTLQDFQSTSALTMEMSREFILEKVFQL